MNDKLTLTELQLIIKDSLYVALPDLYWIKAEISEIKENYAGHCYFELIEKQPDDRNIRARAKAVIWSSRYRFLKSFFENITGETLREGLKILVRVKVEYHEIYGLTLVISDIDPSYTLGDLAVKRQMILKKLEEEGVLNMNKELEFPAAPQRIAIISSKNAAGYSDFMKHLKENPRNYLFYTTLFEAAMQGDETESGVIGAFDRIASHLERFDAVVILRGGGSQTDLSWFDNYSIAYYVTQFPLPVITGIGHEKDLTVTDITAFRALKTPTAVADYLIECLYNTETRLIETGTEIIRRTQIILEEYKSRLLTCKAKLLPLTRIIISELREKLSEMIIEMINTGKEYTIKAGLTPHNHKLRLASAVKSVIIRLDSDINIKRKKLYDSYIMILNRLNTKITAYGNSLKILNPENVLKRGYTITSLNGRIIKSKKLLNKDDLINTKFIDGTVRSKVMQ